MILHQSDLVFPNSPFCYDVTLQKLIFFTVILLFFNASSSSEQKQTRFLTTLLEAVLLGNPDRYFCPSTLRKKYTRWLFMIFTFPNLPAYDAEAARFSFHANAPHPPARGLFRDNAGREEGGGHLGSPSPPGLPPPGE